MVVLREIYVMEAHARVCQLVIETIARVLCSHFPSETMTHPANKTRTPQKHAKESRAALGKNYISVAVSADAKRWNQSQHAAKLAVVLLRLTPKSYHATIIRVLKCWMSIVWTNSDLLAAISLCPMDSVSFLVFGL